MINCVMCEEMCTYHADYLTLHKHLSNISGGLLCLSMLSNVPRNHVMFLAEKIWLSFVGEGIITQVGHINTKTSDNIFNKARCISHFSFPFSQTFNSYRRSTWTQTCPRTHALKMNYWLLFCRVIHNSPSYTCAVNKIQMYLKKNSCTMGAKVIV